VRNPFAAFDVQDDGRRRIGQRLLDVLGAAELAASRPGKESENGRAGRKAIAPVPRARVVPEHERLSERDAPPCHRVRVFLGVDVRRKGIAAELRHERIAVEQGIRDLDAGIGHTAVARTEDGVGVAVVDARRGAARRQRDDCEKDGMGADHSRAPQSG